jgi:hypothetical protein
MRRFIATLVAATTFIGVAAPLVTQADAAMSDGARGARQALTQNAPLEQAQFFWSGPLGPDKRQAAD